MTDASTMTRFHFFTGSQSHGQHINLLCRAACWTSSGRQKLSRTNLPRAPGGLSLRPPCPQPRPAAHPPGSHLHMISCVRSTRHISGFLSCPSYTMACGGQGTRESAQLPPRSAPLPAGRCARSRRHPGDPPGARGAPRAGHWRAGPGSGRRTPGWGRDRLRAAAAAAAPGPGAGLRPGPGGWVRVFPP